ncbi:MAG TPA: hypothetical protein VGS18_05350 [Thermoplasmata archaeon]|nr:hypothetical protein [Thermoplasmata archaeon]
MTAREAARPSAPASGADRFRLETEMQPQGDQPAAIRELVRRAR